MKIQIPRQKTKRRYFDNPAAKRSARKAKRAKTGWFANPLFFRKEVQNG